VTVGLGFEAIAATWANQLDPSIVRAATAADPDHDNWHIRGRYARSGPGPLELKLRDDATQLVDGLPPAIVWRFGTVIL